MRYADGTEEYYAVDTDGLKLYGQYVIDPSSFTGSVYFDAPLLLMQADAQIGTERVSTTTYSITLYIPDFGYATFHVDLTARTAVLGLEDIQTEHTVLRDCIKTSVQVTQYIHETGQTIPSEVTYSWFFKGIGLVRSLDSTDSIIITGAQVGGKTHVF
jgi:hypothetical protein